MAKRRRTTRATPPTPAPPPRRYRQPEPDGRRLLSPRVLLLGLVAVGFAGVIGFAVVSSLTAPDYSCVKLLTSPPGTSATEGFATDSLGAGHVAAGTRISYGFCPPTSGAHYNAAGIGPLRPAFYGPDAAVGPGGWIHNLEHGYVVALYRCANGTCPPAGELAALRQFAANGPPTQGAAACGYRSKVLVARFDEMSTPYALLAWDRALLLDAFDEVAALGFAGRFIEATAPEPNAC
jgi:hypothetical protein